jgi:hypothetical protein
VLAVSDCSLAGAEPSTALPPSWWKTCELVCAVTFGTVPVHQEWPEPPTGPLHHRLSHSSPQF